MQWFLFVLVGLQRAGVLYLGKRFSCKIKANMSSNHRSLELHYFEYLFQKKKKQNREKQWLFSGGVIGGCEGQSCSFSLPSILHTLWKRQTKIQIERAGLMSFDSCLYMIPSSFQVSDWLLVYTGWTFISWLWVCLSNNQLWRLKSKKGRHCQNSSLGKAPMRRGTCNSQWHQWRNPRGKVHIFKTNL